jgi:ribosome-associated protein
MTPAVYSSTPAPYDLARAAAQIAIEKKATDVLLLRVGAVTPVTDYFVLATGHSEPQVRSIVDAIDETLAERGVRAWHVEGRSASRWVLIDYVDVVVHVFHREAREFYMLERLWGDAPREAVSDEAHTGTDDRSRA